MNRREITGGWCVCLLLLWITQQGYSLSESMGPGGSNARAVHQLGFNGRNVHIGFLSAKNVFAEHEAFLDKDSNRLPIPGTSRVILHDILGLEPAVDNHDTNMAGILISSGGVSHPDQIGAAPGAFLHNVRVSSESVDFADIEEALDLLILAGGNPDDPSACRVITTGFQLPCEDNGDSLWTLMFDYYAQTYDVIFSNAAGNYMSAYPSITHVSCFGGAYNGITVGGLINMVSTAVYDQVGTNSLSGTTVDGRMKPDVCAPAPNQTVPTAAGSNSWGLTAGMTQGFTSWAIPHTAGVAALLIDKANATLDPDDGRSEVIKAVIVNSAFPNLRSKSGDPTTGEVWNADRGFGRLDALRAFDTLSADRVTPSIPVSQAKGWAYETLRHRQEQRFVLNGWRNHRLIVTLTWHRKVAKNAPGNYSAESPACNLDLAIEGPSGESLYAATDPPNNLLKADLLLAADGFYEITVRNTTEVKCKYALAFELLPPLEGDFDANYIVDAADLSRITDAWLQSACPDIDLEADGFIDALDFSRFSAGWLTTDPRYYPLP